MTTLEPHLYAQNEIPAGWQLGATGLSYRQVPLSAAANTVYVRSKLVPMREGVSAGGKGRALAQLYITFRAMADGYVAYMSIRAASAYKVGDNDHTYPVSWAPVMQDPLALMVFLEVELASRLGTVGE